MKELNINEMKSIEGGTGLTSSMLTAIYKTLEVIYQIGESLVIIFGVKQKIKCVIFRFNNNKSPFSVLNSKKMSYFIKKYICYTCKLY